MKGQIIKYAAVGLAGYFIGFYEMKYKTVKCMLKAYVEESEKEKTDKNEKKGGEGES